MPKPWIPTLAGKACADQLDRLPPRLARRADGAEGTIVAMVTRLASDDLLVRYHGRQYFAELRDMDANLRVEARYALPFLAALAAGDDVADEHAILHEIAGLVRDARGRGSLHRALRQTVLDASRFLQMVAAKRAPAIGSLVAAVLQAAAEPSAAALRALARATSRHRTEDSRFFHRCGLDEPALRARAPIWVPRAAGKDAYHEHDLIGGPDFELLQSFIKGQLKLLWGGEEARRARREVFRLTQAGLGCSRVAGPIIPFLAAYAAGSDVPDRHMLTSIIGLTTMHAQNRGDAHGQLVLEAGRASTPWMRRAAAALDPVSSRLLLATIAVVNEPTREHDRVLRNVHGDFLVEFGGP